MTRDEFFIAFDNVVNVLIEENVPDVLREVYDVKRKESNSNSRSSVSSILKTFSVLDSFMQNASSVEIYVIESMDVGAFFGESFWTSLMSSNSEGPSRGHSLLSEIRKLNYFLNYGPSLTTPLRRSEGVDERTAEKTAVFIIPDKDKNISLDELHEAIRVLASTYSTLSEIYDDGETRTEVLYIESGSKVRVKVRGNGKSTRAITDLIAGIFNRNVFRANFQHSANTENLLESLSAYEQINLSLDGGNIDQEQAARLKEQLNRQVSKLSDMNIVTDDLIIDREGDYKRIENQSLKRLEAPGNSTSSSAKKKKKKKKSKKKTDETNGLKSKTRRRRAPVRAKPKASSEEE